MNAFLRSKEFDAWLSKLRDKKGTARIVHRIRSAEQGNFGDCSSVGEGVYEVRVHVGPGYRIYFTRRGGSLYLLLLGATSPLRSETSGARSRIARTYGED
ncbi:type II toxin-antitoxin system RelE/ParE family toxin [Aquisalimonas sp.]|uniref:type II toxin-antitoxin system RelE/ParE family toxin n=1 Tax=Aquisalimonas sp. TaxID=1872621 RepID=UPI0025BA7A49|nr:type II toxin-antitoxin system RelE/ParE family toxin [Aquisalimonas sp.]